MSAGSSMQSAIYTITGQFLICVMVYMTYIAATGFLGLHRMVCCLRRKDRIFEAVERPTFLPGIPDERFEAGSELTRIREDLNSLEDRDPLSTGNGGRNSSLPAEPAEDGRAGSKAESASLPIPHTKDSITDEPSSERTNPSACKEVMPCIPIVNLQGSFPKGHRSRYPSELRAFYGVPKVKGAYKPYTGSELELVSRVGQRAGQSRKGILKGVHDFTSDGHRENPSWVGPKDRLRPGVAVLEALSLADSHQSSPCKTNIYFLED